MVLGLLGPGTPTAGPRRVFGLGWDRVRGRRKVEVPPPPR